MENHEASNNGYDYPMSHDFSFNNYSISACQDFQSQTSTQHFNVSESIETPAEVLLNTNKWKNLMPYDTSHSSPSFVLSFNNSNLSSGSAAPASESKLPIWVDVKIPLTSYRQDAGTDHGQVNPASYKANSDHNAPTSCAFTFDSSGSEPPTCDAKINVLTSHQISNDDQDALGTSIQGSTRRSRLHAQEHIIAERQRREKLNQCFIALSAVIPDLKKMDKATILEEAVKYLKHLKERLKALEEQSARGSSILVKKSQVYYNVDGDSTSTMKKEEQPLPEIEVRTVNRDVLIKIHCVKQKGVSPLPLVLSEIEKRHLTVINSNILPFGNSTLYITLLAQMKKDGFCMTMKDLAEHLRQTILTLSKSYTGTS